MFDAFKVGEKWTTVIPSTIDVDFFDSVARRNIRHAILAQALFLNTSLEIDCAQELRCTLHILYKKLW